MKAIRLPADVLYPGGHGMLGRRSVTAGKMEILLEVGSFDVDGGVEMTLIQVYIDVQKHDLGGGSVPSELDGVPAFEAFKELGSGVRVMG